MAAPRAPNDGIRGENLQTAARHDDQRRDVEPVGHADGPGLGPAPFLAAHQDFMEPRRRRDKTGAPPRGAIAGVTGWSLPPTERRVILAR